MEVIVCKNCGSEIKVDEYDIQECKCGAYYRRRRGFEKGWSFAGWWKGMSEKEKERQAMRPKDGRKRRRWKR